MRFYLAAFGDPGHLFPLIALGRALVRRGHTVRLESWRRWREPIEAQGIGFVPAPEHPDLRGDPLSVGFYTAAQRGVPHTAAQLREFQPDLVVADILTLAPALAAERLDLPYATVIPHPYPLPAPGNPPFSLGARPPRTRLGAVLWLAFAEAVRKGFAAGRSDLNRIRTAFGLPPRGALHGGLSERLVLVATFPQLEYPRRWPDHVKVVGPLIWEPPTEPVGEPPGDRPLVLVAPSTSQDRDHLLLRAALRGLADAPVRVLATWNGRPPRLPLPQPPNALVVPWLSYRETMARAAIVICHGGHGTVARALSLGKPTVVCPVAGDMFENGARVAHAGVGLRLPRRLIKPGPLRDVVVAALADPAIARQAEQLRDWYRLNDPATAAAALVEQAAAG